MDEIRLTGLTLRANHGVFDFEKEKGQKFVIDVVLYMDTQKAGVSDSLPDTVNYGELACFVEKEFTATSYDLLEAATERLALAILKEYDILNAVKLTVSKPEAPIDVPFSNVCVSILRKWHKAYLSIGSNIGESKAIIERAYKSFEENAFIRNLKSASLYNTKPYGYTEQPDFVNTVWELETTLSPENLLKLCNDTEQQHGRERLVHWGPRTLDIDIVYYDNLVLTNEKLTIPHCDMHNREFVLKPLNELAPKKVHPVYKKSTEEMLESLK